MPNANQKMVKDQMTKLFEMQPQDILRISAKKRIGIYLFKIPMATLKS